MDNLTKDDEMLDLILEKSISRSITWEERDFSGSYKAAIGPYEVHVDLDREREGSGYELWVFNKRGNIVISMLQKYIADEVLARVKRIHDLAAGEGQDTQLDEFTQFLREL